MHSQQIIEAQILLCGLKEAFDALVNLKKMPRYDGGFTFIEEPEKAVRWHLKWYNDRGALDYEFQMDFPYKIEFPEEIRNNPMLNWRAARPASALQVIPQEAFDQMLENMFAFLQVKYPAVADMPHILADQIRKLKNAPQA